MPAHRKAQATLYQMAVQTEEVYSRVSELTARVGTVWAVPETVDPVRLRRTITRMLELEDELPVLRRQFQAALDGKAA